MIQKHAELKTDVHKKFKDGKGQVFMEHFLDLHKSNGAGRLFSKVVIAPGSSIGLHKHEGDCEVFYLLKGEALVTDNGAPVKLGPGDVAFCRDGETHGIENSGSDDLEFIAVILFTKQKEV
ncbi:MAG: cupin domain-containing protein [Desulfovibrio sp.]|nr:cupin domain-containing protein [Desulfovibrio sp.]